MDMPSEMTSSAYLYHEHVWHLVSNRKDRTSSSSQILYRRPDLSRSTLSPSAVFLAPPQHPLHKPHPTKKIQLTPQSSAMGKSRSATLLTAYLLSTNPSLDPQAALTLIRQIRPSADPNAGFMHQLHLYHSTSCSTTLDANPAYQRWLYHRTIQASISSGTAPETDTLPFGDEGPLTLAHDGNSNHDSSSSSKPMVEYRCRRCRTPLATSAYLVPHTAASTCSHLHVTPLSWMRPELELGKLEGRLQCPNGKCGQSVGRYAWQGMKCSCGEWVVPGMTLGTGRVDEVRGRVKVEGRKI